MLIAEIKSQLRHQHSMSLLQMIAQFKIQPDILRDMLALLIKKGQVRKCLKTPSCGTKCLQCSIPATEVYEWVEG